MAYANFERHRLPRKGAHASGPPRDFDAMHGFGEDVGANNDLCDENLHPNLFARFELFFFKFLFLFIFTEFLQAGKESTKRPKIEIIWLSE